MEFERDLPYVEDDAAVQKFLSKRKRVAEAKAAFWSALDYFETLATSVNCGIFDIEVVQRVTGPKLVRTFDAYRELILDARIYYGRPSLYKEMEQLAASLRALSPDDQRDPNRPSFLR